MPSPKKTVRTVPSAASVFNRVFRVSSGQYCKEVILPGLAPYASGALVSLLLRSQLDWQNLGRWEALPALAVAGLIYLAITGTLLLLRFTTREEKEILGASITGLRRRVSWKGATP